MGQSMSTTYKTYVSSPDTSPNVLGDATYSHDYGFHAERKKRSAYCILLSSVFWLLRVSLKPGLVLGVLCRSTTAALPYTA